MERDCDFCAQKGRKRPAIVDCKTIHRVWAYCCRRCRRIHSVGRFMPPGVHVFETLLSGVQ